MAKITAPNKEFTGKRGTVAFVDGVAETDDPHMLTYFKRHGYAVEGEKQAPAPVTIPDGDPAESWKGDELKAYAAAHEIDLKGATTKADMVAAIQAAKAAANPA